MAQQDGEWKKNEERKSRELKEKDDSSGCRFLPPRRDLLKDNAATGGVWRLSSIQFTTAPKKTRLQ